MKEEVDYYITIKDPNDYIQVITEKGILVKLYVIKDVPESYQFKTNTQEEIKDIKWF